MHTEDASDSFLNGYDAGVERGNFAIVSGGDGNLHVWLGFEVILEDVVHSSIGAIDAFLGSQNMNVTVTVPEEEEEWVVVDSAAIGMCANQLKTIVRVIMSCGGDGLGKAITTTGTGITALAALESTAMLHFSGDQSSQMGGMKRRSNREERGLNNSKGERVLEPN